MNEVALDTLTLTTFLPLVKTRFRVRLNGGGAIELELLEATPARAGRSAAATDPRSFSLCFAGPAEPILDQRMHRFEHDQIGWFDLFIVQIGKLEGRPQYEALFNR